jgi:RNA polymerase sigma-70 factor (ECF subfamily)
MTAPVDGSGAVDIPDTLALVRRSQENDLVARDELFTRYLPRVRAIVAMKLGRRVSDLAQEEDIVQESMLHALRGLGTFQPRSDGTFYDWIGTIVANRIRDAWRRSTAGKRDVRRVTVFGACDSSCLSASMRPDSSPSPSEVAVGAEAAEQLESALLGLDERHREAIVLRELCGMSYAEITDRLGLGGESSARSLVTRAKADLAEKL